MTSGARVELPPSMLKVMTIDHEVGTIMTPELARRGRLAISRGLR